MKFKQFLSDISIEDMPNGDLKMVAEICGMDVAVKLLKELGGINIYIPQNGLRAVMRRYVKKQFNGRNAKDLANELGISLTSVYRLLKE